MATIELRRNSAPPLQVEDVSTITYVVGETTIEIRLRADGSVYVGSGSIYRISIEPIAANGVVIKEVT